MIDSRPMRPEVYAVTYRAAGNDRQAAEDDDREIAAERRPQTGCGGGAQLTHSRRLA